MQEEEEEEEERGGERGGEEEKRLSSSIRLPLVVRAWIFPDLDGEQKGWWRRRSRSIRGCHR